MEDLKLWRVIKGEGTSVRVEMIAESPNTETERLFEDLLVTSPDLLEPGLKLIARQFQTDGGPLDLLGIDGDGRLVLFELKREALTRAAVAQAIDYASCLTNLSLDGFASEIAARSGSKGIEKIEQFQSWYSANFERDVASLLQSPRIVLVGIGIDDGARRVARFLASFGMEVTAVTFHAYDSNGQMLLARSVEVAASDVPKTNVGTGEWTQSTLERQLLQTCESMGLTPRSGRSPRPDSTPTPGRSHKSLWSDASERRIETPLPPRW